MRDALFGVYAWFVFGTCVLLGLCAALLVPGASRRARWIVGTTKAIFVLSGIPVVINGLENLPTDDCVVVANHSSHIDGFLLKGYLPARFSFVIKGELRNIPIVHFLLRRAGSHFVERKDAQGSTRDARQIVKAAQSGQSLALFPEGTFQKEPGVQRFRAGAFLAAVKGNLSVVPIAISGTRHMLPSERHLPRCGSIQVDILPPISIDDPSFSNHRALAELARQRILAVLDEPDLVGDQTHSPGAPK